MSYIAKIYLKKMFKKDCIEIVDGNLIKVTVNNVINPMEVESLPDDSLNDHFEFIDESGNVVAGKGNEKAWEKMKVEVNGKTYDKDNYKDIIGTSLDRGGQYIVYFPNPGWSSGEQHALTVKIHQDRPIEFTIKREIQ